MKAKISALMDGELREGEIAEPLHALREEGEALATWREYHLIGDTLRDSSVLSNGFSQRFAARLAEEPTILAPSGMPRRAVIRQFRVPLSMAAGLAAVVMVGSIAFPLWMGDQQVAQAPAAAKPAENPKVAMPKGADDYLRAHQSYSPRNGLQGVAPYVRTVSESAPRR